ncbi:MAG: hypothetical protein Q8P84_04575 [Deltaproteobacteria bacterium]|nr:hypothetical protein [Deltaproteobacteria bacterium]
MISLSSSVPLGIFSSMLLTGPAGLMEACRGYGPLEIEDHHALRTLLPVLSESLSGEGLRTVQWSSPLRHYLRGMTMGDGEIELKEIAVGLRSIPVTRENDYQKAVDRSVAHLMGIQKDIFVPSDVARNLQHAAHANPKVFLQGIWYSRLFGTRLDVAEKYGRVADVYRMRGDLKEAADYYHREADAYFIATTIYANRKRAEEVTVAAVLFEKSARAYFAAGDMFSSVKAEKKGKEMRQKAERIHIQTMNFATSPFWSRLSRDMTAFFENARPSGRDAAEMEGYRALHEKRQTHGSGGTKPGKKPFLRLIK